MTPDEVLATLRQFKTDLRARGVRRAALFGSLARGTAGADSDIDIMIEVDPDADVTLFEYVGLKNFIADLFVGPVDVVDRDALRDSIRPSAEAEALYAF